MIVFLQFFCIMACMRNAGKKSMEEVQEEVKKAARSVYDGYVQKGLAQELAFKGAGTQYIQFAVHEPKLFHFCFYFFQNPPESLCYQPAGFFCGKYTHICCTVFCCLCAIPAAGICVCVVQRAEGRISQNSIPGYLD